MLASLASLGAAKHLWSIRSYMGIRWLRLPVHPLCTAPWSGGRTELRIHCFLAESQQ